jgi:energy-coupling factor transporter ATP-binding protein EcfA2
VVLSLFGGYNRRTDLRFPFIGLDSVSAAKVANVLHSVAHDPEHPTVVIASIHQPNSQLYHKFDRVLVLAHGRTLYNGPGGFAPSQELASRGIPYPQGYNVADHLLDVASDPPAHLFQSGTSLANQVRSLEDGSGSLEKGYPASQRGFGTPLVLLHTLQPS